MESLFASMEENEPLFEPEVVEAMFSQLMISAAMKLWGQEIIDAATKEMNNDIGGTYSNLSIGRI